MFMRFKWIYFDFLAWLSYLPFLYFSILTLKNINFSSGLHAFSSIFAIIVVCLYPLYPVLITYQIFKNYRNVCLQADRLVEMSLSPWLFKVKRPEEIPIEG